MDESQLLNLNIAKQALYNTIKYQVTTGINGQPGLQGATGMTGAPGLIGSTGFTGPSGYTGSPGNTTNTGATGSNGMIGYTGYTGDPGTSSNTGSTGPQGISGGVYGVIKVPSSTINFNFSNAVSTLPASFGTYIPGSVTDGTSFTIRLNDNYNQTVLPFYNLTAYVYSSTAGYINCQRQLGVQSGVAAAYITMNIATKIITFNYLTKTNFPYTSNDSNGYALYICFTILN